MALSAFLTKIQHPGHTAADVLNPATTTTFVDMAYAVTSSRSGHVVATYREQAQNDLVKVVPTWLTFQPNITFERNDTASPTQKRVTKCTSKFPAVFGSAVNPDDPRRGQHVQVYISVVSPQNADERSVIAAMKQAQGLCFDSASPFFQSVVNNAPLESVMTDAVPYVETAPL